MLTADLAQSWHRGGKSWPLYIDRNDPDYLSCAADLINIFTAHEGRTRGQLDQSLEEYVGVGTDYKILRGLIKLLTDRCLFEIATQKDPTEIRQALFLKARAVHPAISDDVRTAVLAEAALELECAPDVLLKGLYADLPENQLLAEFERTTTLELIDLYNLAQAQALLYRSIEMRLTVSTQSPEGYRNLFGAIKAYRLMHTVKGHPETGYEVRLNGPVSMFHRSQKYGVQMAVFLPALLLCTGWRLRAEIAQKPGHKSTFYELTSEQTRLRSHYLPAMKSSHDITENFEERWTRFESAWSLERSSRVIDLGESAFIPDYVLLGPGGHEVYLEILGFWTPRHLEERLKEFEHARVKNFILAVWDELRGSRDPLARVPPNVIVFKRNLDPAAIEMMLGEMITERENTGHRTQNTE